MSPAKNETGMAHHMAECMMGRMVEHHSPARLSQRKAKKIVADDSVRGHPLTPKQHTFMRAVAHGMKPREY